MWLDKSTRVGLFNSISIEKNAGKSDTVLWYDAIKYIIPIFDALAMLNALQCDTIAHLSSQSIADY